MSEHTFQIAIDGPVAAGKGSISRLVAQHLEFLYVDTGAMYRTTAFLATQNNVNLDQEEKIVELLKKSKIEMRNPNDEEKDGRLTSVFLDGEDISWKIRTEDISQGSSRVASHPEVRKILVQKQQEIAQEQNVVMEGRDITFRVLPNAQLMIYLTANNVSRTKRIHLQLLLRGENFDFQKVSDEIVKRDDRDKNRIVDPLQIVPDAWVIDSTDLSIQQVVDMIVAKVKAMKSYHEKS
jgi:CMP/dCMP kinase